MRIHHVAISVKNLEETINFYKEYFGFEEINRFTKPNWTGKSAIIKLKEMQIEAFQFEDHKQNKDDMNDKKIIGIKHIAIQVKSVQKKYEELKSKGLDIDKPKKGTTCKMYCFLKDPNGIPLELYEAN